MMQDMQLHSVNQNQDSKALNNLGARGLVLSLSIPFRK